ncbi:hypothetical protein HXY33_04635 [Candidatus Bathyarchaeota archaeon]|nr:hypothetical protein [Candidatus Bathyarchaeota archaeon]
MILIVVAFLATLWATSTFWFTRFPWEPRLPPSQDIVGDIEFFYTAKTVVSTINVTLLVFLLAIYAAIYRKTKSEFTVGLMIFSAVLLLNALASNPFVMWVFGFRPFGLGPFALLPDLFTFAALTVLLYLSIKY